MIRLLLEFRRIVDKEGVYVLLANDVQFSRDETKEVR